MSFSSVLSHSKKISSMKKIPTRFDGYYISEDGKVWTEWTKKGDRGILREVTPLNRGTGYPGLELHKL